MHFLCDGPARWRILAKKTINQFHRAIIRTRPSPREKPSNLKNYNVPGLHETPILPIRLDSGIGVVSMDPNKPIDAVRSPTASWLNLSIHTPFPREQLPPAPDNLAKRMERPIPFPW